MPTGPLMLKNEYRQKTNNLIPSHCPIDRYFFPPLFAFRRKVQREKGCFKVNILKLILNRVKEIRPV